jgi:protein-S-isoprenylcysteine O-methyltransferase Ste14
VVLLVMFAIFLSVVAAQLESRLYVVAVVFALPTVWFGVGVVRAFFIGVSANEHGIVMHGPYRTTVIAWNDVVEIQGNHPMATSAAGLAGATSPAVVRRRAGKRDQRIELRALGSYGSRRGRTLAERAIADLQQWWDRWKVAHAEEVA